MMAFTRFSWLRLALLTAVTTSGVPASYCLAQRGDDADGVPASERQRNTEPPRLMRGGIMQQLRSVTESVIGSSEDKATERPSQTRSHNSNVPSPPPLGQRRRPAQSDVDAGEEPIGRNPAPQHTSPSASAQSRAWAGQFLIPNYRLRDQVGTKTSRPQASKRPANQPSDSVEMNLADSDEPAPRSGGTPKSRGSQPASPRVYLGQRSPVHAEMQDTDNEDSFSQEEDLPTVPATDQRAPRTAQLPKPPASEQDAVNVRMSDQPVKERAEEATEVLVSHVPDIPYVPRKPVPKRDHSKLLENTLKSNEPSSGTPRAITTATAPSQTIKTTQTPTSPTSPGIPTANAPATTIPSANAPVSSVPATPLPAPKLPAPSLPTPPTTPTSSDPPSIPSLELSQDAKATAPQALNATPTSTTAQITLPVPPSTIPTASAPSATLPHPSVPALTSSNSSTPPALTPVPKRSLAQQPTDSSTKPALPKTSDAQQSKVATLPAPPKTTPPLPSTAAFTPGNTGTPDLSLAMPLPPTPPALPQGSLPQSSLSQSTPPQVTLPPAPAASKVPALPVSTPASAPLPSGPASPALSNSASRTTTQKQTTNLQTKPAASSNQADASAAAAARMQMEIPHVQVKLLGPGDLTAGSPTTYELQVQNNDRIPLSGLILRMETPAGVDITPTVVGANSAETEKANDGSTLLTWNVSQVAAGAQARLPLKLNAASARNFAVAIEWTVMPVSGIDEIVVKKAELQVALEGPVEVERNASNSYRIRVSNPGSAPAQRIKLQVSAGIQPTSQIDVGDLAPGQSETVDMDLTFEKAGQVAIGVQAAGQGELNHQANINVNVRQAVLVAGISLPESVPHGSPVLATVELSNTGDAPARKVQAGIALPTGTQVAQLPPGLSRHEDKLLWDVEQVPAGQHITIPLEVILPSPGQHELTFACVGSDGSVTNASANINVEAFADLKLLVNDPPSPAPVGSPVTYELTVHNRGSREARGVVIVAQFSEGIEPESASGLGHRLVPGQVLFETLPHIAAGQSVTLKVVARATTGGVHRFRAEVRCDETEARLVEEESTRFLETTGRIATQPGTSIQR